MPQKDTILYGFHAVSETLKAGRRRVDSILLVHEKPSPRREEIVHLALSAGIAVQEASPDQLTRLVGHRRHQGIAARVSDYPFCAVDELLEHPAPSKPLLLILDQILDPQNLGAIARTARCVGVHGLIVPKDRSAPPSPATSKASAGAIEHLRVASVTNLVSVMRQLKSRGLWIAGADRDGAVDVFKADLNMPLALVIGGEEKGLRPLVRQHCDFIVSIPQVGPIGSLNASVAAGVILYEVFRQRRTAQDTGPGRAAGTTAKQREGSGSASRMTELTGKSKEH